MQITKTDSDRALKIVGTLEIAVAEELHHALRDFICRDRGKDVDLSEVDGCDAAGLQLLCSARKTAERFGRPFQFVGLSAAIRNAASGLGFSLAGDAMVDHEPA